MGSRLQLRGKKLLMEDCKSGICKYTQSFSGREST